MNDKIIKKTVIRIRSPQPLQQCSLCAVLKMLYRLNSRRILGEFPWLSNDKNPFIGIPSTVIENILDNLDKVLSPYDLVQGALIRILLCKKLNRVRLKSFWMKEDEVVEFFEMIVAMKCRLVSFEFDINLERDDLFVDYQVPSAFKHLEDALITMSSLNHLMIGSCDDVMLDIIGAHCPNLVVFEVDAIFSSKEITSQGLKSLCANVKDPQSQPRRCQNLERLHIPCYDEECGERLIEGICWLMLYLPRLRHLRMCCVSYWKAIEKLHNETNGLLQLSLTELVYTISRASTFSPSKIAKLCPFLRTIKIYNVSNRNLNEFQYMENLRSVTFCNSRYWSDFISFSGGVSPFLQRLGEPLEHLNLVLVDDIDYSVIDTCLPNLKHLECSTTGILNGTGLAPTDCIRLLINCQNLHALKLQCCENLDLSHLQAISSRNPLSNLTDVFIESQYLLIDHIEWKRIFTEQ